MKRLLIVVDYQNDFVDGALGFPGAEKLLPYIQNQIKDYAKNGDEVVFTRDIHAEEYLDLTEGKFLPIEHCIAGSDGAKFYGGLEEVSKEYRVFEKPTFGSAELFKFLLEKDYSEIRLLGLVSNICVLSNAVIAKAAQPETKIVVDSKGSSSFDLEMQQKGYDILRNLHIIVE